DEAAEIFTTYKSPRAGELVYRVRVTVNHKDTDGNKRVRLSFRVDGKEVRSQVANFQPNNPVSLEVRTKVAAGPHRLAMALLNPSDDKTPEGERHIVRVSYFEIEEPPEPPKKSEAYAQVMVGNGETRDRARQIV